MAICILPFIITSTLITTNAIIENSWSGFVHEQVQKVPFEFSARLASFRHNDIPSSQQINEIKKDMESYEEIEGAEIIAAEVFDYGSIKQVFIGIQDNSSLWNSIDPIDYSEHPRNNECIVINKASTALHVPNESKMFLPFPSTLDGADIIIKELIVKGHATTKFDSQLLLIPFDQVVDDYVIFISSYDTLWKEVMDYYNIHQINGNYPFYLEFAIYINDTLINNVIEEGTLNEYTQSWENKISLTWTFDAVFPIITSTVGDVQDSLANLRIWSISQMIPILGIILLLIDIQRNQISAARARSIAILKSKGINDRIIIQNLLVEAVLLGAISGIIGGIAGSILINLLVSRNVIPIDPWTALISILIGVLITIIIELTLFTSQKRNFGVTLDEHIQTRSGDIKATNTTILILIGIGLVNICFWTFGILVSDIMSEGVYPIHLSILLFLLNGFDNLAGFVGPTLLLIGLGLLFSKFNITSVFRKVKQRDSLLIYNKRIALTIFIIVGLAVWSSLVLESEISLADWQVLESVGSDIRFQINSDNLTDAMDSIIDIEHVEGVTFVTEFECNIFSARVPMMTVEPEKWANIAYFESSWFSAPINYLMSLLNDNNSIILEKSIAKEWSISPNDTISVLFSGQIISLRVIGLFGPNRDAIENTEEIHSIVSIETMNQYDYDPPIAKVLVRTDQRDRINEVRNKIINLGYTIWGMEDSTQPDYSTLNAVRIELAFSNMCAILIFSAITIIANTQIFYYSMKQDIATMKIRGIPKQEREHVVMSPMNYGFQIIPLAIASGAISFLSSILWFDRNNSLLFMPKFNNPLIIAIFLIIIISILWIIRKVFSLST